MTYNLTVRLFCGEKCFGPGMAQLLRKVQELHSLRAAAMSMNMAYSKAWTITKRLRRPWAFLCCTPSPADEAAAARS